MKQTRPLAPACLLFIPLLAQAFDPASTTSCRALNSLDSKEASSAIASCIDQAPPNGTVELPPGKFYIGSQIVIKKPITLRTQGKNEAMAKCAFADSPDCAELIASPSLNAPHGLLLTESSAAGFKLDHIVINGNKRRRLGSGACQSNIALLSPDTRVTNSVFKEAVCGTGLYIGGTPNVTVSSNTIGSNGFHESKDGSRDSWSDGLTVGLTENTTIVHNEFRDNTDVDLVLFSCKNCRVQNNAILHGNSPENSSFAALMIGGEAGDFTGSQFSSNVINCGPNKGCGFGLYYGVDAWNPDHRIPAFGGSVHDNLIENAQQGINIAHSTGKVEVYNNRVTGSGGLFNTNCGKRTMGSYNIAPGSVIDRSKDQTPERDYTHENWDGCIANYPDSGQHRFPPPSLTSISPNSLRNDQPVTLTIAGSDFSAGLFLLYSGAASGQAAAEFVSADVVRWRVPAGAVAGVYQLAVKNPDGQTSDSVPVTVTSGGTPTPTIASVSPLSFSNERATPLTITGANFSPGAVVVYSGPASGQQAADSVTATELRFTAKEGSAPGTYHISVKNPNGMSSGGADVVVTLPGAAAAAPILTKVAPDSFAAGRAETLLLTGSNFARGATLRWSRGADNGQADLQFVSSSELRYLTGTDVQVGRYQVKIVNPDGKASRSQTVDATAATGPIGPGSPPGGGEPVSLNELKLVLNAQGPGATALQEQTLNRIAAGGLVIDGPPPPLGSLAAFHAFLQRVSKGTGPWHSLASQLLAKPGAEQALFAALRTHADDPAERSGNRGPDDSDPTPGGGGVDPQLGPIGGAGPGKEMVAFVESMFASMPADERLRIENACPVEGECSLVQACIAAGLYDACLKACRANPRCTSIYQPGDEDAVDPTADCAAPDNTQKPGAQGEGTGTVCVNSNSDKAYFVVGPNQSWGWSKSHCWSDHVGGVYSVNTNGGYGYPKVGETDVRATVVPASGTLADDGKTLLFTIHFCKP